MILYFTGTGNSKYAADVIGHELNDEVISINDIIKNNRKLKFHSEKPFVITAPIHAWRFPEVVEKFILNAEFIGNKQIYFVATMVSQTGNCNNYCKDICNKKNLIFKGFSGVPMPDNYVISDIMPDEITVKEILKKAEPVFKEIAKKILAEEMIEKRDKTPAAWFLSGLVNTAFKKFYMNSKNFIVSDNCISCGKCEKICSMNNIKMNEGKPIFNDSCISCYACIHHCPKEAINIKGKTEGHGRYLCPSYSNITK